MTTHARHLDALPQTFEPTDELAPPPWLESWLDDEITPAEFVCPETSTQQMTARIRRGPLATLVSVRVQGARQVRDGRFGDLTASAYALVRSALRDSALQAPAHRHVVRMWNFIPGIHDHMAGGEARYMTFNAGRFSALSDLHRGKAGIAANAPAASGVGHLGTDLFIHALAMERAGISVENPAQIPAYHYSSRWGRVPPCFARATAINDEDRTLLISGTAAVIGEESVHDGDARAQWDATINNISRVIEHADTDGLIVPPRRVDHARIYMARAEDEQSVREWSRRSFPDSQTIEILSAQLCRSELLVEIEAVARVARKTAATTSAGSSRTSSMTRRKYL